jgi:hypothetical protein
MLKEHRIGPLKKAAAQAEREYGAAIEALGMLPATNMAEVFFKAEASCDYDTGRYQIAAYLAADLLDIRDAATI